MSNLKKNNGMQLKAALMCVVLVFTLVISGFQGVQAQGTPTVPAYDIDKIINDLPDGDRWLEHLNEELLPFWTTKAALGNPIGNFPVYRANDGSVIDPNNLPLEYKAAMADPDSKGLVPLDRDYIRMKGRQTYAYGVAYHMTGDEKYLSYAKAGVYYLLNNAVDRINGGTYSYYSTEDAAWEPVDPDQRISQDLAYSLSGIGFYYYLTRDPEILDEIVAIKNYIFAKYYDSEANIIKWVIEQTPDGDKPEQKELVSHLDQIYAYMLWLIPALPEPYQTEWKNDLDRVISIIMEQFYSQKYEFFWGAVTNSSVKKLGTPHTDFGHSIKTLWLIYQTGKMTDNLTLVDFAREKASKLIDVAYIEKNGNIPGSWARRFDENGNLDTDKEWWGLAELDQTTATLSLADPSYARYLDETYKYWFEYMVDKKDKEIWHFVSGKDNLPVLKYPKVHSWKNSLHSFEHALIGYLTTQQLKGKDITLYFAFKNKPSNNLIQPYFYMGKVKGYRSENFFNKDFSQYRKYKFTFTDLR